MTSAYIPQALREGVAAQARYRCGYCLTAETISGVPMEYDHLTPRILGGRTTEENLWLACSLCNDYKGGQINAVDPLTRRTARLFNPRRQVWREHFCWSVDGTYIEGLMPTGRATVVALQLNRQCLVQARQHWAKAGWHPPKD
jgi:hypothetical protein